MVRSEANTGSGPISVRITSGYAANPSNNAFASFRSRELKPSVEAVRSDDIDRYAGTNGSPS